MFKDTEGNQQGFLNRSTVFAFLPLEVLDFAEHFWYIDRGLCPSAMFTLAV